MSLVGICEEIGIELRGTPEGQRVIEKNLIIDATLSEIERSLYRELEQRLYFTQHFFAPKSAELTIKNYPKDGELSGAIKEMSRIVAIEEYGDASVPLGEFVNDVTDKAFQSRVRYSLPKMITQTPNLVRLVQDLSVECQRTKLVDRISAAAAKDPNFTELLHAFDNMRSTHPSASYSKEDRRHICTLVDNGFCKESVETVYEYQSIISFIKTAMIDGFWRRILDISAIDNCESVRIKHVSSVSVLRAQLYTTQNTIDTSYRWILRYKDESNVYHYGQIYSKKYTWAQDKPSRMTVEALLYDILQ